MLSRIVNGILLLLAGAIVGGVGTVAHQLTITINLGAGGFDLPFGLIGALLAFAALLVGLRLLSDRRGPATLAALGAIAVVIVFTQESPGGSVLIPNNLLGQIWVVAPILIAALALAWPDVRHRPAVASAHPA